MNEIHRAMTSAEKAEAYRPDIQRAIHRLDADALDKLLSDGRDPNKMAVVMNDALVSPQKFAASLLSERTMGAVKRLIQVLVAHGASLNKPNGGTSLYEAASQGLISAEFSRFLIEHGYKPRCLESEFGVFHDEVGLAMKHAYQRHLRNYPVDLPLPEINPLSAELEAPVLEVMALYHELGYDFGRPSPYEEYQDNRSLLHHAINFQAHGVIGALIGYGASLRTDDNFNYNLLDVAAAKRDHIAYGLLADAGAPEPGNPSYASREEFAFTKERYLTHKLASEASSRMTIGSGSRQSGRRL